MKHAIRAAALMDELVRRQLIGPAAIEIPEPPHERPWFISMVLGASGWLAGLFALAFVATLFRPESDGAIALCGLVLLAAAFGLYAVDRSSEFFGQLALALSIAGQLALVWAAYNATDSETATAALTCAMQGVLLFVMPNPLAKVLAAFFACCAWALAVRWSWWGESNHRAQPSTMLGPALMGWFVVWLPMVGAVHALVKSEHLWMAGALRQSARAAVTGLLVGLSLATVLSEPFGGLMFWDGQPRTNWLVLWPLLGAMGALLAAVYAFQLRSRALIGMAIVGALLHVVHFYYLLGTSLLIKSGIMLASGVLAVAAGAWLRRRGSRQEIAP